jgi:hypothetical protein
VNRVYLRRHVEILLRDPARRVSAQGAHDLRVPNVDIRMMIRSLRSLGDGGDELDSSEKIPELECFRDDVTTTAPAREIPQLALDRNVR